MKTTSLTTVLVLTTALVGPLRAQDARSPLSLIPAKAILVQWCDGPKTLTEKFADTRLGDLLSGPEITGLLQPMMETVTASYEEVGIDTDVLREALLDYEGRIFVAAGLNTENFDFTLEGSEGLAQAQPWLVCVVAADGHTDLAGAQERFAELFEIRNGDKLEDLDLEGRTFRVAGAP